LGWCHLGRLDYEVARRLQERWAVERIDSSIDDCVLTLEHPPVATLGRRPSAERERELADLLASRSIPLVRTDRGGDVTYHGPGQLVVYPVVRLSSRGRAVRSFVAALEAALIDTAAVFRVKASTRADAPGLWAANGAKLGSVGIAVRRGVTLHGASLNLDVRAERGFFGFDPCGLAGVRVTSLETESAGEAPACEPVAGVLARALATHLGRPARELGRAALDVERTVSATACR
jgi:lipoate-protein ligase B